MKKTRVLVDCINCTVIYLNDERLDCSECHGRKKYFLPAQMMDNTSRHQHVINILMKLFKNKGILDNSYFNSTDILSEQEKIMKNICLNLLKDTYIYNFDLKTSLMDVVKKLD